jgi:hypothetical protein
MKKMVLVGIIFCAMVFINNCSTVTSSMAYPEPIIASETHVFTGRAFDFASARNIAVEAGISAGYNKILSETTEFNNGIGEVIVSLTMIK